MAAARTKINFAQNQFYEFCKKVCTFSSLLYVSSDTTDIIVWFESKETNVAEPNKINDENVQDAENEFKALNSDKEAENVEESRNPSNDNNEDNTK